VATWTCQTGRGGPRVGRGAASTVEFLSESTYLYGTDEFKIGTMRQSMKSLRGHNVVCWLSDTRSACLAFTVICCLSRSAEGERDDS